MGAIPRERFANRVVIITGASSGFGLAAAEALHREGASVVMAARNPERLERAATGLPAQRGREPLWFPCDVSNRPEVDALVAKTVARFGHIDILINNAGSGLIAPVGAIPLEDARALFETNFFGALNCTQAVLPYLKNQRHGHIVNMSSVAGLRGIPNSSMYSASKAALIALSDALRLEVKPFGISVTTICPSRTNDTPFVERAKKYGPIQLYKVPDSLTTPMVVRALLHAILHRRRTVILPFYARAMHALNKLSPRVVDHILYKGMPRISAQPADRDLAETPQRARSGGLARIRRSAEQREADKAPSNRDEIKK
ncbi:MAG TPA: SDR family oxidoreductase [Verrucomicrobiae bacterium]|nr:SDR family oxidoreductase [Verrucomicrobiae bacterium]